MRKAGRFLVAYVCVCDRVDVSYVVSHPTRGIVCHRSNKPGRAFFSLTC